MLPLAYRMSQEKSKSWPPLNNQQLSRKIWMPSFSWKRGKFGYHVPAASSYHHHHHGTICTFTSCAICIDCYGLHSETEEAALLTVCAACLSLYYTQWGQGSAGGRNSQEIRKTLPHPHRIAPQIAASVSSLCQKTCGILP